MAKISVLALGLVLVVSCHLSVASASEGLNQQNVVYQDWQDAKRDRKLPIKLYLPEGILFIAPQKKSNPSSDPRIAVSSSSNRSAKTSGLSKYPVVIFSHGLGGSRDAAVYLGQSWMQHGYIAVFVQHPGSDSSVWQSAKGQGKEAAMANMHMAANARNLVLRAQDIQFVIDQLETMNKEDPVLKGKLDLSRIAVAGHSFGAGTSLAVAGQNMGILRDNPIYQDPRIKSAIYLCPPVTARAKVDPEKAYGTIKIPGLLLTGSEDNSIIGDTSAKERRIPFDGIKAPHQYLVNFWGADHATFGGRSFRNPKESDEGYHKMIEELTLKFLDASLNDNQEAWQWLDKGGAAQYLAKSADFERK